MMTSDDLTRARELIARCLNGVISDAETTELNRLLVLDPAVADAFVLAASRESSLETAFGPESEEHVPAPSPPRRAMARRFIAAGAVAFAAAVALVFWSLPRDRGNRAAIVAARDLGPTVGGLRFSDGSTAQLLDGESSVERRAETPAGIDVALVRGAARFEVVPRAGRRFRVWVGALHVDVIGTVFTVERLPSGVRVAVERGSVKVISGDRELYVEAGSASVVPLPEPPAPSSVSVQATGAVPAIEPPPGTPRLAGKRDEPGVLLKASDVARQAGRLDEARDLLERLLDRHPGDPRAPYAAFILGRVLLDELGRPRDAAAAFARVRVLDPRNPLAQDALARESESWFRAGEKSRARDRASEYLSRYPDGRRRDQVRRYSHLE